MRLQKWLPRLLVAIVFATQTTVAWAVRPVGDPLNGKQALVSSLSDEFDGSAVDTNKWWFPGYGNSTAANSQLVNGNLQLTVMPTSPGVATSPENISHAYISTVGQGLYGYYEVRMKPNSQLHADNAFWLFNMRPSNDGWSEIDIVEQYGSADPYNANFTAYYCDAGQVVRGIDESAYNAQTFTSDYHVFGLDWNENTLDWYVDGVLESSNPNTYWHESMYALLTFYSYENISQSYSMDVDYLRVWQTPPTGTYWDTSTDAGFQAGNGTWDANNTAAWSAHDGDGTSPGIWTSGTDDAVFHTDGTSAVTVSGSPSANSVTFSGTGYTLSGTMIVGGGGIIVNESVTTTAPTLSASQSWTVASGKSLILIGNTAIDVGAANTLTIDGLGTVRSDGTYAIRIGNGTVVQTAGGIYSPTYVIIGATGNATFTTTGGTLNMGKHLYLGYKDGTTSTINHNGGTIIVGQHIDIGASGLGTGVYNLNAGTLKLPNNVGLNNTYWNSYTFNFNGGKMELSNPTSGNQSYTFNVKAGGAKIDVTNAAVTNTFNGALLEDTGSPGGGLQKLGAGTLALNGTNTYTGDTLVDEGTLSISQAYLAISSDVWIASGAVLNLGFTGTDAIRSLYLDGSQMAPGTYNSGNSGGYITGSGGLYVPLPGDANGDGSVDAADAAIVAANWLSSGAGWGEGDFNGDETVNDIDATMLATNFGSSMASVPEPSMTVLFIASAAALLGIVRR